MSYERYSRYVPKWQLTGGSRDKLRHLATPKRSEVKKKEAAGTCPREPCSKLNWRWRKPHLRRQSLRVGTVLSAVLALIDDHIQSFRHRVIHAPYRRCGSGGFLGAGGDITTSRSL